VAWLCGNPRGNGTLELERAVRQLTSLVFLLGAPLSLLAGLALHLQAALLFLAYALVALPAFALVDWARRRAEKEEEAARELREPGYQG